MASIILTISDESLISQIKKACSLLKGVGEVKVVRPKSSKKDITKTKGYQEAMEDVRQGRVHQADSVDDMFQDILGYVPN
ncbi:MAG: response regulator [Bacteroidales bacterium]|jgi:hypothetical protein|nr:response regulator [Bacteroidales bacterium]